MKAGGVSRGSLWCAMAEAIRDPARFFAGSEVSIRERAGFAQRSITANGVTYLENIYEDEPPGEILTASWSAAPGPTESASMPCARTSLRWSPA